METPNNSLIPSDSTQMGLTHIKQRLDSDETIICATRPHWIVMVPGSLIAAVLGVTGVGLMGNHGLLRVAAVLLATTGSLLYMIVFSMRSATEIAMTNKRLLVIAGLARTQFTDVHLSDIADVTVAQSIVGRSLGFGTVIMHKRTGKSMRIVNVEDAKEFEDRVKQQIGPITEIPRDLV